ncbi:hypothetical protein PACTADRAFT_51609 [Pachysolen tannophilus NRRL Y-2460]|uniref:ER membrane protein complex subunit 6 n=1 Tax=Pachysolen tannophilus NRRL Y-2460 TaxID=669874 RepID=A0A1E4TQ34_PACTA|nr:hypothetical protein PACTADRAFT_51609 [Pachysolen tannophilus NRRL Y-2460]
MVQSPASSNEDTRVTFGASIKENQQVLQEIHDITSLAFGTIAGILKLESTYGFLFFLITNILLNLCFIFTIGGFKKVKNYYNNLIADIFIIDISRCISSFTMMWCLVFALIDT